MNQSLGEYISNARKEKNLSMRQLARLSGLNYSEISKIESEKRKTPKLKTLKALCRYSDIYYEDCLYILNLGATYNINNKYIIEHYKSLEGNDLIKAYKGIMGQIELNDGYLVYLRNILSKSDDTIDKNTLIDTIKSLEHENITHNYIRKILEEKILNNCLEQEV